MKSEFKFLQTSLWIVFALVDASWITLYDGNGNCVVGPQL